MQKVLKNKFRKLSNKVEKIGRLKDATRPQLLELFRLMQLKYVMALEDQLTEDKAHLFLKQQTIATLEEDIKFKNELLKERVLN